MHVLMTVQPAFGHLHPLIPTALALIEAGHDVRVATSRSFIPHVQEAGLSGIAAGIDWTMANAQQAFPEATRRRGAAGKQYMLGEIFCGATAAATARDLLELATTWRPDLIVRETWELGGAFAAHTLRVPCVVHGIGRYLNHEELLAAGRDRLADLCTQHGIAVDDLGWVDGDLYLDPCPPCLDVPTQRPRPAATQPIRPIPFDTTAGADTLPSWVDDLGGRPVAYLGLGTVMNRRPGLLETALADLHDLDLDVVVTTGPGRSAAELGDQPANVHIEQYLPLTQLLPRCDIVISHAGWGTTIAALSHGLPQICIPLGADGPTNADRCHAIGAGRTVNAADLPGALAHAVSAVLANHRYTTAAQQAREEINTMPTPNRWAAESHVRPTSASRNTARGSASSTR